MHLCAFIRSGSERRRLDDVSNDPECQGELDRARTRPLQASLPRGAASGTNAYFSDLAKSPVEAPMLYAGEATEASDTGWDLVRDLALDALGADPYGHRSEFLELAARVQELGGV